MTIINITSLSTLLGGATPIDEGAHVIDYWAGDDPYIRVDGDEVIFPEQITVRVVDGEPVEPIELEPTGGECCVRWIVRSYGRSPDLVRFVAIPNVPEIDFEQLADVDPASFVPVEQTPTLVDTILQVLGDQVEPAVADYLEAHPPTAGTAHTQSAPSATWVIPHTFGRIPAVAVYIAGELVDTDVTATTTNVTITFPAPFSGVAVLN